MKTKEKPKSRSRSRRTYSAMEKAQAVLAIWAETRRPSEICKDLEVSWTMLNYWQKAALEGMLDALEPRSKENGKRPALGSRLKKLLDKKIQQREKGRSKLQQRLEKIQQAKENPSEQK
jgi:transposase-like protein